MEWIPIVVIAVLALIVVISNIHIVQQSRAYVIERLGAFSKVWQVGMHVKVPFIERVAKKVSLKEQVLDRSRLSPRITSPCRSIPSSIIRSQTRNSTPTALSGP